MRRTSYWEVNLIQGQLINTVRKLWQKFSRSTIVISNRGKKVLLVVTDVWDWGKAMKLFAYGRRWKSHWEWMSLTAEDQYDIKSFRLTFHQMYLKTSYNKDTYIFGWRVIRVGIIFLREDTRNEMIR